MRRTYKIFYYAFFIISFYLNGYSQILKDRDTTEQYFRIFDGDTINKIDEMGLLQGEWERLYPNGDFKCKGKYKDGKKTGYWERKYPNGEWEYQMNMENGYPHGYCKWYYKNGNIKKEANYKNGFPDGVIKSYYENGTILSEESYENVEDNAIKKAKMGIYISEVDTLIINIKDTIKMVGVRIDKLVEKGAAERSGFVPGDIIIAINDVKTPTSNDLINSMYKLNSGDTLRFEVLRYYKPIQLFINLTSNDFESLKAVMHGKCKYYSDVGKLLQEGEYKKGKFDGVWDYFTKEGKLTMTIIYKDGNTIDAKSFE